MIRPRLLTILSLTVIACSAVAVGCGGESNGGEGPEAEREEAEEGLSEQEREQAERAEAAKQIPAEDRLAYYQLTTTLGLVRSRLLAVLHDEPLPEQIGGPARETAERRVRKLVPSDSGLQRSRRRLLAIMGRGADRRGESTAAINAELTEIESITAAISRFLKREPAQSVLVPD